MLWMFKISGNQRQIESTQYLTLLNLPSVKEPTKKASKSMQAMPNWVHRADITKTHIPEANSNGQKIELESAVPSVPKSEVNSKLDLDLLRGQAVQIERTRVKSGIEKMNDSKKLNLSIEATFDRDVNKIELPDCRQVLLGKLMLERMRIIQDHSKKKFCRSSM